MIFHLHSNTVGSMKKSALDSLLTKNDTSTNRVASLVVITEEIGASNSQELGSKMISQPTLTFAAKQGQERRILPERFGCSDRKGGVGDRTI
jgi:hypothetical protein